MLLFRSNSEEERIPLFLLHQRVEFLAKFVIAQSYIWKREWMIHSRVDSNSLYSFRCDSLHASLPFSRENDSHTGTRSKSSLSLSTAPTGHRVQKQKKMQQECYPTLRRCRKVKLRVRYYNEKRAGQSPARR